MKISIPSENCLSDKRIALIPAVAARLIKLGAEVLVEAGLGKNCFCPDELFSSAGAQVVADKKQLLGEADIVLRLHKLDDADLSMMKPGALLIGFLNPFNSPDYLRSLAVAKISAIAMELIPRSTRAQKMDALSSQASLAGYSAVMLAANHLPKILPMMTTPSGTISPAKVFIIGAGVAGLQAIATAKRLGAIVTAFDTRAVVEEQVKSLGAKFLKIDLGDTGQTKDGYAKSLTEDQLKLQRAGLKKICAESDIVITTAQTFGRLSPVIITKDMLSAMKPGSVVVDLAVESGGNVEGVVKDQETVIGPARVFGYSAMATRSHLDASLMYANNLYNLISEFWNKEQKSFVLNRDDEIIKASLVTHGGEMLWKTT